MTRSEIICYSHEVCTVGPGLRMHNTILPFFLLKEDIEMKLKTKIFGQQFLIALFSWHRIYSAC